jgi:FkbM family methyltransferase
MSTLFQRVSRFAHKSPRERRLSARHFTRIALSKIPYLPMRTRLPLGAGGATHFWWSYVDFMFQSDRKFSDYWGHDLDELCFLWNMLRPEMVVFDVGAHHGIYSVLAAKRVGSGGRVVAFEPSPAECRRLRLHLRMNAISTVAVEPMALSSSSGQAEFFRVIDGYKGRSGLRFPLFPDSPSPVEPMRVEVTTLDEYVRKHRIERLDLMKVDVEGAELEILRGGSRVISTLRPMALCEIWDFVTHPWGHSARDVITQLETNGYRWFDFQRGGFLSPHELQNTYGEVKNFLAVPEEKVSVIADWIAR